MSYERHNFNATLQQEILNVLIHEQQADLFQRSHRFLDIHSNLKSKTKGATFFIKPCAILLMKMNYEIVKIVNEIILIGASELANSYQNVAYYQSLVITNTVFKICWPNRFSLK